MVCDLQSRGKTVDLFWVKGHEGMPGNDKADVLAGQAAEREGYSKVMSLSHLKLQILEKFRKAKTAWHNIPSRHGTEEIPPPPPRSPAWNALVRTAAQIRTGHWRSAAYLKRIRKMTDDKCWFCRGPARMTRSHVLLHCPNERLRAPGFRMIDHESSR
jgi:hypothetical protein